MSARWGWGMGGDGVAAPPLFRDRRDAGRRLGLELAARGEPGAVVVGLARGGLPVAAEVAAAMGAPLDLLVVRKVGHPLQPELAVGAVTAGGQAWVDPYAPVDDPRIVEAGVRRAAVEAAAMETRMRGSVPPVPVAGRTCVLVDDGLATGATMRAAVRWARAEGARRVVVAVPVAARPTAEELAAEADAVACPHPLDDFRAVGLWYRDFGQVPEDEAVALVRASRGEPG